MKKRSPVVMYLLLVITYFIYFLYWFYKLLEDLNTLKGENIFNPKKAVITAAAFMLPLDIFVLTSYVFPSALFNGAMAYMGLVLLLFFIVGIILFCRFLKKVVEVIAIIEKQNGVEVVISYWVAILLLFFNTFGLPYIQVHMNKIIRE